MPRKAIDVTGIPCRVDGCSNKIHFKAERLCKIHYFRRRRTGVFDDPPPIKGRSVNKRTGYVNAIAHGHPLANKHGVVREHRMFYYDHINKNPTACEMCGTAISWKTLHIDHKDSVTSNNELNNLRAVCRACNVYRAHKPGSMGKRIIELDGLRMTVQEWARMPGVVIAGHSIWRRKLSGWSDRDAIYGTRLTHQNMKPAKTVAGKADYLRGIPSRIATEFKRQIKEQEARLGIS